MSLSVIIPARDEEEFIADDYDGALAKALDEDKMLLVNFTGHT